MMELKEFGRLALSAVTLLLSITSVVKAYNATDSNVATVVMATTKDTTFLKVTHKKSTTTTITVNWSVSDEYDVEGFNVEALKAGSQATVKSPTLSKNDTEYKIEDLSRNTRYNVCVHAVLPESSADNITDYACLSIKTIPLIRWDNLLAVICVLLALLLLVLLGLLCWRHAKKKQQKRHAGEENDHNKKSESTQPILLAPPVDERPRSSIEDEDIPYITPPIEELENDEREYALKASKGKGSK